MVALPTVDLEVLLGGMDNLAQGFVGSIVGVLGAYGIAVHTTRKELQRDRQLTREFAGVESARNLIAPLSETLQLVDDVRRHDFYGPSGSDSTALLSRINATQERLQQSVLEHGSLLPRALEQTLSALPSKLPGLVLADFDEDGFPILVEPGNPTTVKAVEDAVVKALDDLQSYRRDPLSVTGAESKKRRGKK